MTESRAFKLLYEPWIDEHVLPKVHDIVDRMSAVLSNKDYHNMRSMLPGNATQHLVHRCVIPMRLYGEFFNAVEAVVSADVRQRMEEAFRDNQAVTELRDGTRDQNHPRSGSYIPHSPVGSNNERTPR